MNEEREHSELSNERPGGFNDDDSFYAAEEAG